VLGAFKATPTPTLEAEAAIQPIGIWLEQAVLSYQLTKGIHPITTASNKRIRAQLRANRGPRNTTMETPMERKHAWARTQTQTGLATTIESSKGKKKQIVRQWGLARWEERWTDYQQTVPIKTPAQTGPIGPQRLHIHQSLAKAESSILTQIRTEKIGLAAFLYRQKVPNVASASCSCGWLQQTPKHIAMFCPDRQEHRQRLFQEAGTTDFQEMVSTKQGAKAIAKWFIQTNLLTQFSLAKEQLYG
jgi:hypothetical protein